MFWECSGGNSGFGADTRSLTSSTTHRPVRLSIGGREIALLKPAWNSRLGPSLYFSRNDGK
jgi:hypothetical protein